MSWDSPEQNAAFIFSRAVAAHCEFEAMRAENYKAFLIGEEKHSAEDFRKMATRHCLDVHDVNHVLNEGEHGLRFNVSPEVDKGR